MREPRVLRACTGGIMTTPDSLESRGDFAVSFIQHSGYSLMYRHEIMALARSAVDRGTIAKTEPQSRVTVQCPCGVVEAFVEVRDGKSTTLVQIIAHTSFLYACNLQVEFRGRSVTLDLTYGGYILRHRDRPRYRSSAGQRSRNRARTNRNGLQEISNQRASNFNPGFKRPTWLPLPHPVRDNYRRLQAPATRSLLEVYVDFLRGLSEIQYKVLLMIMIMPLILINSSQHSSCRGKSTATALLQ